MASENPFSGNTQLGGAWEEGYLAGFSEPEVDHFRPFAPDVLEAYSAGDMAGRDDRRSLPPGAGGTPDQADVEESGGLWEFLAHAAEESGIHLLAHKFFHDIFGRVGGLIPLLITVVQIPGDVQLKPMEDDWAGPVDMPEDTFVAVCTRDDHGPMEGATAEGYWTGPARQFFSEALADKMNHHHAEAGVARCSMPNGDCGLVWPGEGD